MKRLAAALLLIVLAACEPEKPAPAAPKQRVPGFLTGERVDYDGDNLLSIIRGASVIDRTAELSFQHSAAQAIDGAWLTTWISPGRGTEQTLTFALAARSRIRRAGVTPGVQGLERVRFESSLDGTQWTPVTTLAVRPEGIPFLTDVKPFEAQYVRVTSIAPGARFAGIGSVHAIGEEVAPPHGQSIDGCWTINGEPARFAVNGAYVTGVIGEHLLEGGFDGRVAKLMWRRRGQWGYMMISVTPDGRGISGVQWHEVVGPEVSGDGWIGQRSDCAAAIPNVDPVRARLLERTSRWPLYGLAFDANDELDPVASAPLLDRVASYIRASPKRKFRLVSRELRLDANRNRARAGARLDAVRAALAQRGIDVSRIDFSNAGDSFGVWAVVIVPQKEMACSVDLEVNG